MKVKEVLARLKHIFVKRKYKDILFRFVFREKEQILQLYNAINKTHYTNADDLVVTTMEDVIYIGMKNDLSFVIANELNLYEHQSTLNENMPLRGFFYYAKLYEGYVEVQKLNRYQKKRIELPFPRYVVFYNGEEDAPEEWEMRLSDAFGHPGEEPAVECVAKFININYGCNQELLQSCKRLHDYSYFVATVRGNLKKGFGRKAAVVRAVDECINKGILEDVLAKHRAEVENMFLTTFDKKMYEEALREEAREEVREELATQRDEALKKAEEATRRAIEKEEENRRLREEIERLKGKK